MTSLGRCGRDYFDRYGGGGGDELLREEIVVVDRGVPITGDPAIEDLTDILIEGLGNLGGQCVSDLGARAATDGRIAELRRERGEIHFESWDSSNPINNSPNVGRIFNHIQTVNEYWRDRNEQDHVSEFMQPAGRTVAYNRTNDEGGIDAQKYHTIILGPAYFNPGLDAKGLQLAGGNIERYRQTILVHEYLHLLNDLDDQGLFNHFHLGERGYGGLQPTNAITEWLLSNCANR